MSRTHSASTDGLVFIFLGDRLWLDFVNTDDVRQGMRVDLLRDFDAFLRWLEASSLLDAERSSGIRRRAQLQLAGASAVLAEGRRIRATLRALAERGAQSMEVQRSAVLEINRVLGRSVGTRRLEERPDGTFMRSFIPGGDAFAALMIPVVESAADSLVTGELIRVKRCGNPHCPRVFLDSTRNGRRRWCQMGTCGNRAKASRHRARVRREMASRP